MKVFSKRNLQEPDKRMYRLAVFTVIGLVFFNQLLIQYILNQQWNDAKTISLASKQRLLCYQIVDLISKDKRNVGSDQVNALSQEWNEVHFALQNGSEEIGVDKLDGEEVVSLFNVANPYQFKIYYQATGKAELGSIEELQKSAAIFTRSMDQIVNKCEVFSQVKIYATIIVEVALALITLLVLMFEIVYIFKPAFFKIKEQQSQLKKENIELAKTQHLLQTIQDSTSVINVVVNNDYQVISFNKQAAVRFEFIPNENIADGKIITDLLPEYMRENFITKMKEVSDQGYSNCEVFCLVDLKDKTRWFDVEFHAVKSPEGWVEGVAFSMKDITTVKEFELDLLSQNEKLRNIAFIQAHELRGPITSMQGLVSLIIQETHSKDFEEGYAKEFTLLSNKVDKIVKTIVAESEETPTA